MDLSYIYICPCVYAYQWKRSHSPRALKILRVVHVRYVDYGNTWQIQHALKNISLGLQNRRTMTSWHPITLTPITTVTQKMRQTGRHAPTQINDSQCLQVQARTGRIGTVSESSPRPRGARLTPLGNNHDAITQSRKLSYKRRPYRACKDSYVLLEVEDLIIIHFNSSAGLPQCPPKWKTTTTTNTTVPPITDTERLDDHWSTTTVPPTADTERLDDHWSTQGPFTPFQRGNLCSHNYWGRLPVVHREHRDHEPTTYRSVTETLCSSV